MKVAEVERLYRPLAEALLKQGLTLRQIQHGLNTVVIMVALEKHGRKQSVVAQILGVPEKFVSRTIQGEKVGVIPKPKRASFDKRHGGASPQQVLGSLEL